MRFKEILAANFQQPIFPPALHDRDGARKFLESKDANNIPLEDFEKRFGISGYNYPASESNPPYYRPENPVEIAKNKKIMDEFLRK